MQKRLSHYYCIIYYSVIVVLVAKFATKTSLWKMIPEHLKVWMPRYITLNTEHLFKKMK